MTGLKAMVLVWGISIVSIVVAGLMLKSRKMEGARVRPLLQKVVWGLIGFNALTALFGTFEIFNVVTSAFAADTETAKTVADISLGKALAIIGVGLPTAASAIGAAIAVAAVGSSALGSITEKPELFGRTLVYVGLAEGVAIYGVLVSVLLLLKI